MSRVTTKRRLKPGPRTGEWGWRNGKFQRTSNTSKGYAAIKAALEAGEIVRFPINYIEPKLFQALNAKAKKRGLTVAAFVLEVLKMIA